MSWEKVEQGKIFTIFVHQTGIFSLHLWNTLAIMSTYVINELIAFKLSAFIWTVLNNKDFSKI